MPFHNQFPVPVLEKYLALFFLIYQKTIVSCLSTLSGLDLGNGRRCRYCISFIGNFPCSFIQQVRLRLPILQDRRNCQRMGLVYKLIIHSLGGDDNFGTIGNCKSDGPNKPNSVLFSNLFTIKRDQLNRQLV